MKPAPESPPPLPPRLARAMREMGEVAPPGELSGAVSRKLARAEAQGEPRPAPSRWARASGLPLLLTGLAGAVVALSLTVRAVPEISGSMSGDRRLEVVLAEGGDTWVPLPVGAHPDHRPDAEVYVEAPHTVRLRTSHEGEGRPATCSPDRCVHRWRTPRDGSEHTVHVGLAEPGQYELRVTYVSPERRASQLFVVQARRRAESP